MRFIQAFQQSIAILKERLTNDSKVIIIITSEKQSDLLEPFQKMLRTKINLKFAERIDRELIIEKLFKTDPKLKISNIGDIDITQIAKYL